MKRIWKFPLKVEAGRQTIQLPKGSEVLSLQMQGGAPHMWVLADPDETTRDVAFFMVGTGYGVDATWRHVGTVQDGDYVWHLFRE